MGFTDLSGKGISSLESYLKTRSYIEGFEPSQADVVVYKELKSAPSADANPNVSFATGCHSVQVLTSRLHDGTNTSLHTITNSIHSRETPANKLRATDRKRLRHQKPPKGQVQPRRMTTRSISLVPMTMRRKMKQLLNSESPGWPSMLPRRPERQKPPPSPSSPWMSSRGTMRPIWTPSRLLSGRSRKMVSSGEVQNSFRSGTVYESCRSTWSLRTTRSHSRSCRRRSRKSKTLSSPLISPPCKKYDLTHAPIYANRRSSKQSLL